jgi:hypothetical protein
LSKPVKSFLTPPHEQPVREKTPTADTQNATGSATDAQPAGTATSTGKPPAVANADSTQAPTLAATAGQPQLKASRKSDKVAGIACRVILEMLHGKPVMEHCMANAARLKVTKREVITLARTFTMARARQLGWLGIGSKDEEFVSIRSRDLRDNRTLELKSVSIAPLPAGYLRIPREYKQLEN